MNYGAGIEILINNLSFTADKDIYFYIARQKAVNSLLKDISDLLNSKPAYLNVDNSYGFIINYGLQDLSYYSPYSKKDQIEVSNIIKDCLRKFEPRLNNISVIPIIQENDNYSVSFHFKIIATMQLQSELISLILESKIDVNSKRISLNLAG